MKSVGDGFIRMAIHEGLKVQCLTIVKMHMLDAKAKVLDSNVYRVLPWNFGLPRNSDLPLSKLKHNIIYITWKTGKD